jgi:hypothetical protein
MTRIEPDLTTGRILRRAATWNGEPPPEARARAERYAKAYVEYEKAYATWLQSAKAAVHRHRQSAFRSLEQADRSAERRDPFALDSMFQSPSP